MILKRRIELNPKKNYLLLGPRRVGKSTFLKSEVTAEMRIDLLMSDVYFEYRSRPALLRERLQNSEGTVVIDEIQRIPELSHEVHWLIENTNLRFILSGSSARKLRKQGVTNLAGRLRTERMFPLTWQECPSDVTLMRLLQYGALPPILFSDEPELDLKDYCGEYLREEVHAEGFVRNLQAFTRFLELAAFSNAEIISYTATARDCGVSAKTVAEYYQILEDTLLGYFLEPFTKTKKCRAIQTKKFYYFDCGVTNCLLDRKLSEKTAEFGKSFEQFIVLETLAAASYNKNISRVNFWRSANGHEVDLLLNENTAVEIKSRGAHISDAAGILALEEDIPLKNKWIVTTESSSRQLANGIEVLTWKDYLQRLSAIL
ncbi:MAG: AAA family ATPase [Pseudomonadota bacterium]